MTFDIYIYTYITINNIEYNREIKNNSFYSQGNKNKKETTQDNIESIQKFQTYFTLLMFNKYPKCSKIINMYSSNKT